MTTNYKVELIRKGDSFMNVKTKAGEFTIDLDGKEYPAPLEVLLASLGACMSFYIRKFINSLNIPFDIFKVQVDADLILEGGYKFKKINVSIDTDGAVLDDAKKLSLIQFVKNCPVHNTLRSQPEIEVNVL